MTVTAGGTWVPDVPATQASSVAGPGALTELLSDTGAVLLRDAGVTKSKELADLAGALRLCALDQPESFAPRQDLGSGVWSQPSWPSTAPMCMHHELGWQWQPPTHLLVACLNPPASGGRTGVADGRRVLSLLPDRLTEQAERYGWTLLRRYRPGLIGMAWQDAFPGMDVQAVERYAAAEGIELKWGPDGLVTHRRRPALRSTGTTGAPAWSNLLAFCSEWTMDPAVRHYLVSTLGRDHLPFETGFGDGTPFTAADVEAVNAAYDQVTAYVDWRAGDVLVLDNVRTAHSMEPFTGERRMAVLHAGSADGRP